MLLKHQYLGGELFMTSCYFKSVSAISIFAFSTIMTNAEETIAPVPTKLDDVIVTAQRRTERLQDVPMAITAVTAAGLNSARVKNIADIIELSPSVEFRKNANAVASTNILIRGLGTTGTTNSFEGSVGVFVDGVYRTRPATALQTFNDIDSLQILRGPQGTLFGKNTTSGAILLSSTTPSTQALSGSAEIGAGNYSSVNAKAAINVPLSETAALRVSGIFTRQKGAFTDPNSKLDYNGDETFGGKAQIVVSPTDAIRLKLIGDFSQSKGRCCYGVVGFINGPTQPLVDGLTQAFGLRLPSARQKDYEITLNRPGNQKIRDKGIVLIADFDIGTGSLKSTSAYRDYKLSQVNADPDFSGADILGIDEQFETKFYSQEITYTGKIEALKATYVLGGYFSSETIDIERRLRFGRAGQAYVNALLATVVPPGFGFAGAGDFTREAYQAKNKSYAGFTHGIFTLSDKINLVAGLRYSIEKKQGSFDTLFFRPAPPPTINAFTLFGAQPGPSYNRTNTDRAFSGTLGLQYRPSDNFNLYATYNRGFKAGGIALDTNAAGGVANNPAITPGGRPTDPTYKPETINAFEGGVKAIYLEGWARTNFSLFYNSISDLQIAQFLGLQFAILNAKSATSYGAEIENSFKLNNVVTLDVAATWLPFAKYGKDPLIDPVISGQRFKFASELAANVALSIDQPITDQFNFTGRIALNYSSSQFIDLTSAAKRGDLALLNATIGVHNSSDTWGLEAWVQNLGNAFYFATVFPTPLQTGDQSAYVGNPRTFGITARAKF
jgi:iron complex outermembrane recepter protein